MIRGCAEDDKLYCDQCSDEFSRDSTHVCRSKKAMTWISVKDRLPEEGQEVLVFQPERYIHIANHRPESWAYRWNCDTYGLSPEHVTHWMPLPEPPEVK